MRQRQLPSSARKRPSPPAQTQEPAAAPAPETSSTDESGPQGRRPAPLEAGGADAFTRQVMDEFVGSYEALLTWISDEMDAGRFGAAQSGPLRARLADFRALLEGLESVLGEALDHPVA